MHRLSLLAAALLALAACGTDNAPSDHTLSEDGVMHKSGLLDPLANCTACHGASLTGGKGPSCYSCHGQKW